MIKTPQIKYVIWDWNGTLINDSWLFVELMNDELRLRRLPEITVEDYNCADFLRKFKDKVILIVNKVELKQAKNYKDVGYELGFGNPYGDEWNEELVESWVDKLNINFSPSIIAISDTIGCPKPEQVERVFTNLNASFNEIDPSPSISYS